MNDLRKAAEMALERLESHDYWADEEALQALRQALAQPDEVLAEREACAEICDLMDQHGWKDASRCALEIRARGEK